MTKDEMTARKVELERKLAARTQKSGFSGNCAALREEIALLEAKLKAST